MNRNYVLKRSDTGKYLITVSIVLAIIIVFTIFFTQRSAQPAPAQTVASSSQIVVSPDKAVEQFYSDLSANNYSDAYALLSVNARQSLNPAGGITYFEQQMQSFMDKYGTVMSYTIENQVKKSPTETVITLTLHRTKLTTVQTEQDTFRTIFENKSWVIDNWGSNIANRSH